MEREFQKAPQRRRDIDPESAPDGAAHFAIYREFVAALRAMSVDPEALAMNFGWCAAQIVGAPDAPAKIRGMLEFALAYRQAGMEAALGVLRANVGVPVRVISGEDGVGKRLTPGLIIGLVGVEQDPRETFFNGVALVRSTRGRERLVAVTIGTDGHTQLHRDQYDFSKPDLISNRPIVEIFPPEKLR
jgi:hypothetical protein